MTAENISFVVGSLLTAYVAGFAWGASMNYFKQFIEKI